VAPSTISSVKAGDNKDIESYQRFFEACLELSCNSDLLSVEKLITTPENLFGIDLPYGLFVRQEYFTLLNIINSKMQRDKTKKEF
jgi:hypothetical protein